MSAFSAFKSSIKAALKVPHTGHKSRSRRQVMTFNEALEDLKASQTGFVICAAFNAFGRCRKEIDLLDSNFLANLNQLDLADVQAPVKLMPLMLCSTHWGKTVYYNALFLDWLSVYGSKQDHPEFENTVVDYQSAIAIDSKEIFWPNFGISSRSTPDGQGRPVSAPDSSNRDQTYLEILTRVDQVQINSEHESPSLPETEVDCAAQDLPDISIVVGMESFASIELGVANLEIMYQENLKCIAMTSDGWRCPTLIYKEQQLRARELLGSSAPAESGFHIKLIPKLILCPGHAIGELPQIYSEKWAIFSQQRLSKEEAMSKFNADFWISVQFFSNEKRDDDNFRTRRPLNRPRSASHLSSLSGDKNDFGSSKRAGGNSRLSPRGSQTQKFEFLLPNSSSNFKIETMSTGRDDLERASSPDHPANSKRINRQPVFTNAQQADTSPEPDANASASKEAINEAISMEKNTVAQDSRLNTPTVLLSSHGAIQQNSRTYSQEIIDKELIQEINAPLLQGGYVHVFWSPSRKLCKVGKATDINIRKRQIQAGCQLQYFEQDILISKFTRFPERVMKFVQLELQNFRAKINCDGRHDSDLVQSEHGEWFDVTGEVATRSVNLWCDLTRRIYTSDGTIKAGWENMLNLLPKPQLSETILLESILNGEGKYSAETYHFERINRYNKWIKDGVLVSLGVIMD